MTDTDIKNTEVLRKAVDDLLKRRHIKSGNGPPLAYFDALPMGAKKPVRYTYTRFSSSSKSLKKTVALALEALDDWLQPGHALLWRIAPEIKNQEGVVGFYFRCVQLDSDVDSINVIWPI